MALPRSTALITALIANLFVVGDAQAAGIDCSQKLTETETAICQSPSLQQLDTRLNALYDEVRQSMPAARQAQREWLQQRRAACNAAESCLSMRYLERIAELEVERSQPSKGLAVLKALEQAIEQARQTQPELAVTAALEQLAIKHGVNDIPTSADASLPRQRPASVTPEEWYALLESKEDIDWADSEWNSYTLIDFDGDGQRDLLVQHYAGGTGLWAYYSAWKLAGHHFVSGAGNRTDSLNETPYLFSTNDRGANQGYYPIRLQGRNHIIYMDSRYGVDYLYLVDPFSGNEQLPLLMVNYQYHLSVPLDQEADSQQHYTLDRKRQAVLNDALRLANPRVAQVDSRSNVCDWSEGADPGHYTIEIVADFLVWIDGKCHAGRLIDWFGSYTAKDGLFAQLNITGNGEPDKQYDSYTVTGRRTITSMRTGLASLRSMSNSNN